MEDPGNEEQHGNDSATTKAGTFRYLRIKTIHEQHLDVFTVHLGTHLHHLPLLLQGGVGVLFHKELQQSNEKLFWIHFYPTVHYTDCL